MYVCALLLRNCGHYTMVRSDLGSDYLTCRFLSEESLYAGMTRGETRTFGRIEPGMESQFFKAYEIPRKPVWFTPGMFVDESLKIIGNVTLSRMKYNVIDEAFPSTNRNAVYDKKGNLGIKERSNIATFGSIESVLPNHQILTFAISSQKELLETFQKNDIYLMGKKRTMFEVMEVSGATLLIQEEVRRKTVPVQVRMQDLNQYYSYTIHEVNARYFLVEGEAEKSWRAEVKLGGEKLERFLPELFVEKAALLFEKP